ALAQPQLPRAPDGHPDLQGIYDIATMTPLEREAGTPLVMTKEEAARLEKVRAHRVTRGAQPSDGNRKAPPVGGDGSQGAAGNVGGYNNFWVDNGTEYFSIDGQKRMSIIVDPPDGRMPQLTQAGQQRTARFARQTSDAQENDPGFEARTLRYRFTIEDPQTWTRSWTGEEAWPITSERLFEYACHEGNYALGDILRGARQREADRTKQ